MNCPHYIRAVHCLVTACTIYYCLHCNNRLSGHQVTLGSFFFHKGVYCPLILGQVWILDELAVKSRPYESVRNIVKVINSGANHSEQSQLCNEGKKLVVHSSLLHASSLLSGCK